MDTPGETMTPLRTAFSRRENRAGPQAQAAHHGRALRDLLRAAWVEYELDHARYFAVAMIYYALVSLVPLLLLLLAALGLLLRFSAVAAETERRTLLGIEARLGSEVSAPSTRVLDTLQQESVVAIMVSVAGLLLAGSVLFKHLRLSFRAIWNYDPPLVSGTVRVVVRATILERAVALAMVLGGGGLLLMALGLIAATQWLDRLLGRLPLLGWTPGWILTAAISLILAVVVFACLFKFLPPLFHPLARHPARGAAVRCRLGGGQRAPGALRGVLRLPQRVGRGWRRAGDHAVDEHRQPGALLRGRAVQGRREAERVDLARSCTESLSTFFDGGGLHCASALTCT
jgi:uncharacterized BrkB/YihY/UPF0761 family membrane protein